MRVNHFPDYYVMVNLLDDGDYPTFNRPGTSTKMGAPVVPLRKDWPLSLPTLTSAGLKKVKARLF